MTTTPPAKPPVAVPAKPGTIPPKPVAPAVAASPAKTQAIPGPVGYGAIVAFDKKTHAGLGLKPDRGYGWTQSLNAVLLSAPEFGRAALDYPIVFVRNPGTPEPMPAAVLSLEAKRNLFLDAKSQWRASCYVPAYVRCHPFCIVQVPETQGSQAKTNLVCVEDGSLVKSDKPLLDAKGDPTADWAPMLKMMEAMETARAQTVAFGQRLDTLGLLTPFDALATPNGGKPLRLQGMLRVDEAKLNKLDPRDLKSLQTRGELRAIYAHLLSLENFARLLDLSQLKN